MAENKNKIIIYKDWITTFEPLTDEEAGKLIKHLFRYINDFNPDPPDRLILLLFAPIMQTLKRDLKAYKAKCLKNKDNINERWNKKDTNEYKRIKTNTKHTDSDSDSDSDSDIDNDSIKENKNTLPTFEEFKTYALENNSLLNIQILELKYKAWVQNGWKDGNNKKIVNWKSKLLNTIPYLIKNNTDGTNFKSTRRDGERTNSHWDQSI